MNELRLMERYAGTRFEVPHNRAAATGVQTRREPGHQVSVKGHLWRLLNTRRGSAMIDPDYGIPDLSLGSQSHDADAIETLLRSVIERYEPRLRQLRLSVLPAAGADDVDFVFLIQGVMSRNRENLPVELKATLMPDGTCDFE